MKIRRLLLVVPFLFVLSSCQTDPEPIQYGTDACTFCKMTIMDPGFGAELITSKGKIFKFDSNECLVHYLASSNVKASELSQLLVTDHSKPGNFIEAGSAHFLKSERLKSPMGEGLSAYEAIDSATASRDSFGGDVISWDQVRQLVK